MDDREQRKTKKAAAELMNSKVRVDRAVEEYTQAQRLGDDARVSAAERLHNAVMGFWWRMREHVRDEAGWDSLDALAEVSEGAVYDGPHPQTGHEVHIDGLCELGDWLDKTVTRRRQTRGPLSSTGTRTGPVTIRLPPEAARTAAEALMVHFERAGWDAKPEETTHVDEPDGSDLEGLLLARGQTKAASQLPERFKGNGNADDGGDSDE